MKRLWRKEAGEGLLSGLYTLLVLALLLFLGVEILSFGVTGWKLYTAGGELLELMKAENGLDGTLKNQFHSLCRRLGLEELNLTVEGTPKYVQRGEPVELEIRGHYPLACLRPFGRSFQVPLHIRLTGLAHTYLRSV